MNRLLPILTLALVIGAWTGPQAQAPKAEGFPAVGEPATIAVSSTGAEPRTRLRYRIAPTYRGRMEMSMTMGMTINMDGAAMPRMDIPTIRMIADVAVTEVAPSGEVSYNFGFVSVDADDPSVSAAMQKVATALTEIKGIIIINDRGEMKSTSVDPSKISDPQMRQTMSSAFDSMRSMSLPLPEEAVGPGAKWQVRQSLVSNGIHSTQRIDVELVSADARSAMLKMTTVQQAAPQKVDLQQLPGASVTLQKLNGTGIGTVNIALDALIPTSEMTSHTNTVMDIAAAGSSQTMGMDMTLKLKVAPGK
jgi:hypothetical protein